MGPQLSFIISFLHSIIPDKLRFQSIYSRNPKAQKPTSPRTDLEEGGAINNKILSLLPNISLIIRRG